LSVKEIYGIYNFYELFQFFFKGVFISREGIKGLYYKLPTAVIISHFYTLTC